MHGISEGTVLFLKLFTCQINDLPDAVKQSAYRRLPSRNLGREINNHDDHRKLQKDPWESYYQLPVNGHTLEQVEVNSFLGLYKYHEVHT